MISADHFGEKSKKEMVTISSKISFVEIQDS